MSDAADRLDFARSLRRQMDARGVSKAGLARAIGTSASAVYCYRQGSNLPTVTVANRIADALLAPHLLQMVVRMRTRTCVICGTRTVDAGTKPRTYCSKVCLRLRNKGVRPRVEDGRDIAIARFCKGCEPEEVCRTEECPLRAYSPFPYFAHSSVTVAAPSIVWTDERRRAVAERMGRYWRDPVHRAEQAERRRQQIAGAG